MGLLPVFWVWALNHGLWPLVDYAELSEDLPYTHLAYLDAKLPAEVPREARRRTLHSFFR